MLNIHNVKVSAIDIALLSSEIFLKLLQAITNCGLKRVALKIIFDFPCFDDIY